MLGRLFPLLLFISSTACLRSGFIDNSSSNGDDPPATGEQRPFAVGPMVAGQSDRWNAYVRYSGGSLLSIDSTPCSPTPAYRDCRHGGELRRLDIPELSSCDGVSVSDSRSIFDWTCLAHDGIASVVSTGLAEGRGLRNLIDFDAASFFAMHVTARTRDKTFQTEDAIWWSNAVSVIPDDQGSMGTALRSDDTIYIVPRDHSTVGIMVTGRGVALVTAPGARILGASGPNSCDSLLYGSDTTEPRQCLMQVVGTERVWLEVAADSVGAPGAIIILLASVATPRVHHTELVGGHSTLQLLNVAGARITDTTATYANSVLFRGLNGSLVRGLRLAATDMYLLDSRANVFEDVTTFGRFAGLNFNGGNVDNVFVRPLSFAHSGYAMQIAAKASIGTVVVGYTFANTGIHGIGAFSGNGSTFHLGIVANANQQGVDVADTAATFSSLASSGSRFANVEIEAASSLNRFTGQLRLGGLPCNIEGGASVPGLTAACEAAGLSSELQTQIDLPPIAPSFVGLIDTDDAVNTSDINGAATVPAVPTSLDLAGASNRYRGWVENDASTFLGSDERNCPGATSTCWSNTWRPNSPRRFSFASG